MTIHFGRLWFMWAIIALTDVILVLTGTRPFSYLTVTFWIGVFLFSAMCANLVTEALAPKSEDMANKR